MSSLRHRPGFTVVELLVVVAVIVLLVGILVTVLSSSAKAAQATSTRALMGSISNSLVRFKTDIGYLPPVLGLAPGGGSMAGSPGYLRDLLIPQVLGGPDLPQQVGPQNYCSITSLVEYLVGPGGRDQDGYGAVGTPIANSLGSKEIPSVGIRAPLRDGAWGAYLTPVAPTQPLGTLAQRNLPQGASANSSTISNVSGRVLGPYLELKDATIFGAVVGVSATGAPIVARPGDNNYNETAPRCVVDYWGQPIRYYRRGYANADPKLTRGRGGAGAPGMGWDLGDVFALRPQRFAAGTETDGIADGNGDTTTSRGLQGAEFALFSMGPDRGVDFGVRIDAGGLNEDNIAEVGK
ncbi:MAG: prepilin-type N-terminal cleavage/methylation domain-containing protein [Phycisphaerales bacterium]|nr:prepilin-type N-terminal cleavage/methylation domain-containing protein [Phycisphaerales bacterium]